MYRSRDHSKAQYECMLHDRIVGCLIGSALGDAIGFYTEFLRPEEAQRVYPSGKFVMWPPSERTPFTSDIHRNPLDPGGWTEDTDHAMMIVLDYIHLSGNSSPRSYATRLQSWLHQGLSALDTLAPGIGGLDGKSWRDVTQAPGYLFDPSRTAYRYWRKYNYDVTPSCSLMRTHPLGINCVSKFLNETFQNAANYSAVTHSGPRFTIACAISIGFVRGNILGHIIAQHETDNIIPAAWSWSQEIQANHNRLHYFELWYDTHV